MAKKSKETKHDVAALWTLRIVDAIIMIVPLLVYFIMGMMADGVIVEKITLIMTAAISLILTIFNILAKKHLRSIIWIMVLGLYVAVDNLIPLIICLAITSILDEFLFIPLIDKYKMRVVANKTYDRREA